MARRPALSPVAQRARCHALLPPADRSRVGICRTRGPIGRQCRGASGDRLVRDKFWGRPIRPARSRPMRGACNDMQGNVSEWVADWFAPDYYEQESGQRSAGPGEWLRTACIAAAAGWRPQSDCRASLRGFNFPGEGYYNVDFASSGPDGRNRCAAPRSAIGRRCSRSHQVVLTVDSAPSRPVARHYLHSTHVGFGAHPRNAGAGPRGEALMSKFTPPGPVAQPTVEDSMKGFPKVFAAERNRGAGRA